MKVEFCKGAPEDRQDILDFGDLVFSKNSCPHDFQTLLPKLYGPQAQFEPLHYMVKEDGKIRAMICVLPMEYQVGDDILKINGVGTVSVHPVARSRGYMKKLLAWALEDMEKEGYDFSVLGGQRQRYEYFGYTPMGSKLCYTVTRDNLRHRYAGRSFAPLTLRPMEEGDIALCYALYEQQLIRVHRSREEFQAILCSWTAKPRVIENDGVLVGYLCRNGNHIPEILLHDPALFPDVLHALLQTGEQREAVFVLPEWDTTFTPELGQLAESIRRENDHNYRVFHFPTVVQAFLQVKAGYTPLPDGHLTLAVDGQEPFTITVEDGMPAVKKAESAADALALSPMQAQRLLFAAEGWREVPQAASCPLVRAWFPLPLFTPEQDNC